MKTCLLGDRMNIRQQIQAFLVVQQLVGELSLSLSSDIIVVVFHLWQRELTVLTSEKLLKHEK